mgnify:CR=1 FL=1
MKKILAGLIILLAVGVGIFLAMSKSDSSITGNVIANPAANAETKVFVVDSSHLRFYIDGVENPDIVVNEGDKVRIEFTSTEGFHDWVVDEFSAATEKVQAGGASSVEFIADKKGTFEYYCSVGKHRANGMFGKFIVE